MCEHANEVPAKCRCITGCYCKNRTCGGIPVEQDSFTFSGIDRSVGEDFLDEMVGERSEKNPYFQALLEEASNRLGVDRKLRASIHPLVEQLAATAYAMGRRDERKAAEEDLAQKLTDAHVKGHGAGQLSAVLDIADWAYQHPTYTSSAIVDGLRKGWWLKDRR
jgi:hypothetical protein